MEGEHLVVSCTLSVNGHTIATHGLIDSGATGIAFIDKNVARHHQLPLIPLLNPRSLEVIDGHPILSGDITHTATVKLSINEHQEELPMFVTQLGHDPIVLGIPWMDLRDINIRFHSRTVTFGSQYCSTHCPPFPTVAYGVAPEKLSNPAGVCSSSGTVNLVSNVAQKCEPAVSAEAGDIETQIFTSHSNFDKIKVDNHQAKSDTKQIQIAALGGHSFRRVAHKRNSLFSRSPYMKSTLRFNLRKNQRRNWSWKNTYQKNTMIFCLYSRRHPQKTSHRIEVTTTRFHSTKDSHPPLAHFIRCQRLISKR